MKRVVVGLSGGVDSSVTALLLKEQGYEVIGMFMQNWHDTSVTISDECPWIDDSNDAQLVADTLGIPFQVIDLSEDYKKRIVDYMFHEYEIGRTPNPDVLCNREIKFDIFLKAAMQLGADYVATGHYCQKEELEVNGEKVYNLVAGKDNNKDQSYFLCQLSQYQLSKALFPIGHLEKPEVRRLALEAGLVTAEKKDSQGLCFIGKVRLPDFLQQQLKPKKGKAIELPASLPQFHVEEPERMDFSHEELKEITRPFSLNPDMGKELGEHSGAHYYTIGQRKGLGIGGSPLPLFVVETDTKSNIVYMGQGHDFPGLLKKGLFIPTSDVHWIREDLQMEIGEVRDYDLRIRYRQKLAKGKVYCFEGGLYLVFEELAWGVTPGQFATWYEKDRLIGSGVIS
ncbi:MAG: tRNA 2-thiouridine(34) synthase MnmA [Crocinitomicaceae bacterium]|nr:tRNA 2-thiouridine(34) synthase MnmA [Crocinitomicaceae bacterium]